MMILCMILDFDFELKIRSLVWYVLEQYLRNSSIETMDASARLLNRFRSDCHVKVFKQHENTRISVN